MSEILTPRRSSRLRKQIVEPDQLITKTKSVRKLKKPLQNSTNIGQIDEQCEILSEKVNQIDELKNEIAKLKQRNAELEELTLRLETKQRNLEEVNQKLIDENETFRIQLKLENGLNLDESQLTPCPSADNSMDPEALESLISNISLVGNCSPTKACLEDFEDDQNGGKLNQSISALFTYKR